MLSQHYLDSSSQGRVEDVLQEPMQGQEETEEVYLCHAYFGSHSGTKFEIIFPQMLFMFEILIIRGAIRIRI